MVFDGRTDLSGKTIAGRYQLRDVIGRGGMAVVYRAYQPALDRQVAVKVIADSLARDPEFAERFRREARTVARLRHPNILTVHDFGEEDGLLYLVTELIDGGTLQSRLHELRSSERAVDLIAQIGAALDFAHTLGIVHRDVKPLNIFLDGEDGTHATLADFGIAKVTAETTGNGLTGDGNSIGTPEYMAPEQLTGGRIDGRADLYALAAIAYQLLTGRLPIARGGPQDTPIVLAMRKVQTAPPAPSTFNPNLSPAVDRVLLRALAPEPHERFATAADFVGALRAALAARPSATPPRVNPASFMPQRPTWEYPPVVQQEPQGLPPANQEPVRLAPPSEAVPPLVAPTYHPPAWPAPAVAAPVARPVPPAPTAPMATTMPMPGAPAQPPSSTVPNAPPPTATRRNWTPIAGAIVALLVVCLLAGTLGRGVLARVTGGGAATATATTGPAGTAVVAGNIASVTPTSTVAPTGTAAASAAPVVIATPSTGPAASASSAPSAAPTSTVAPLPTATVPVAATAPPATVAPTVAPTTAPTTAPTVAPVATAPPAATATATRQATAAPSGAPTGQLLYSSDKEGRWAVYRLNPDGSGERRLTNLNADNYHGVWSPDGATIAFVSERDNNPEIYLMDADGGNQRRLTTDQGGHSAPVWSPDGSRVAYILSVSGADSVYYVELATNKRTGLINAPAGWPAWASNDAIAWTRVEGGLVTIYLSTVTGTGSTKLPRPVSQSEDTPAFSPDGKSLAFAAGTKNDRQIVVTTATGENRRAITARGADNSNPVWSPDGAWIAYSSTASGTQQLVVMRSDGANARTITAGSGKKWYLSWR